MKSTSLFLFALGMSAMMLPTNMSAKNVNIVVTNNEPVQRQELVEVSLDEVYAQMGVAKGKQLVVKNTLGQEVAYQITFDGKLLIDASVRPCGKASFTVSEGKPQEMKVFVTGKMYPERVDDIAWENDRTAYRLYGPALQRSGEKAYGIDVWVKNTPDLEVDKRYKVELSNHAKIQQLTKDGKKEEAKQLEIETTYHFDHGYGLDCYKVGPTLGCGAPAIMENGLLVMPYSYKNYKILDNGPLRFTVELTYNPTVANGDKNIIEHRLLSLDKGSNFNRMRICRNRRTSLQVWLFMRRIHRQSDADVTSWHTLTPRTILLRRTSRSMSQHYSPTVLVRLARFSTTNPATAQQAMPLASLKDIQAPISLPIISVLPGAKMMSALLMSGWLASMVSSMPSTAL